MGTLYCKITKYKYNHFFEKVTPLYAYSFTFIKGIPFQILLQSLTVDLMGFVVTLLIENWVAIQFTLTIIKKSSQNIS